MASLDKTSVRTEVSRLKTDFEQLCTDGKITSESKTLMLNMFLIVELILSIFLEKATKKDNKNSSIPSSQTGKDESALGQQGSNGKGKKETKTRAKNTRVREQVTIAPSAPAMSAQKTSQRSPVRITKDAPRLILFLKKSSNMWMQRLSNVQPARPRSKLSFLPICTAPCNMARA